MTERPFPYGVEVEINDPEKFLLIKESLTRIGVPSDKKKTLTQTAHILHKRGRYFICHFKELFALDKKDVLIDPDDIARRNLICVLLRDWGLCSVIDVDMMENVASISTLKVLSYRDKNEWELKQKYTLGDFQNKPKTWKGK